MEVLNITFTNETPNTFQLEQAMKMQCRQSISSYADGLNTTVSLADNNIPFMNVTIPSMKSGDGSLIVISQQATITNTTAFAEYNAATMLRENVTMQIYGKTHLKQACLPSVPITYNRSITMAGMLMPRYTCLWI